MSIVNEAMIVNLAIGAWLGYRLDKDASRKVTDEAGADADSARVNKHIIPKEALKPIITAQGALRTHFYANTLPWKDNGDRILTRKRYPAFIIEHEQLIAKFNEEVEHFLKATYPAAKEQAEFRMGKLFKPEDYPSARQLRHRFYAHLEIDAVTEAGDFRVELDGKRAAVIRSEIEQATEQRIGRAMADVWQRLADTLGHFHAKMADKDAIFRNSTVSNLEELVEILPDLNVVGDPNIEKICQQIKSKVIGYAPDDLRKDALSRGEAAKAAKKIMDEMSGFMSAFGQAAE